MLIKPPIEQLLPKATSRYTLAMLVAKRTRQLVDGAQPMAQADSPNLVTLACEEIAQDKVACVEGIHTPVVPLRPEIEEARRLARELAANQAAMDIFPEFMDAPAAVFSDDVGDVFVEEETILEVDDGMIAAEEETIDAEINAEIDGVMNEEIIEAEDDSEAIDTEE